MKTIFYSICAFLISFSFAQAKDIVPPEVIQQLETTGLSGSVHGADPERGLYVFSYNLPGDFFKRFEFSLLATTQEQRELVKTFNRGDRIHVIGRLGSQMTPQPHVYATAIKVLEKYNPRVDAPAGRYPKETNLPEDLSGKTEFVGQVHAVVAGGEVVVMEYKEVIIPLVVTETQYTQDLFRGDLIRVYFELQGAPNRPTHVVLKSAATLGKAPVEMLQRLVERHGLEKTLEGRLVLFPKSPTINRDVWAIEEDLGYGLARYSTLVDFTAEDGMDKIDAHLRAMWNSDTQAVLAGRNKFIHTKVKIRATGSVTVFVPNQANAQLNLKPENIVRIDE